MKWKEDSAQAINGAIKSEGVLMKFFILFSLLVSNIALADTFKFQLYYDEELAEKLDIKIEINLSGKFEKGSKIQSFKIWGEDKNKDTLLFNFKARDLELKWTTNNTLKLTARNALKPLVKKRYYPAHSDTQIDVGDEFDFENLVLSQNGTLATDREGFFLANQTAEEMGLMGFLKKI